MKNTPATEYFSIGIEFDFQDFDQLDRSQVGEGRAFFCGRTCDSICNALRQLIDSVSFAPPELWHFRRQELLHLIYLSGYRDIAATIDRHTFSRRLQRAVEDDLAIPWDTRRLAASVAVSESTLRRKLKAEGTNTRTIVGTARLGRALDLIQTTFEPIGHIAEACGFQSQSRFTQRFKHRFGIGPTELRRTRSSA